VRPGLDQDIELVRLAPPPEATGPLTPTVVTLPAAYPATGHLGAQAIDLPFFDWTAVSWTSDFGTAGGEVLLVHDGKVDPKYSVNSLYAAGGVGSCAAGRLLYTGLSDIDESMVGANALYAADSCGTEGKDARLLPYGDATCGSPIAVDTWGEASGPVATDSAGNAIAVMVTYDASSGDPSNEARGFEATKIARGAAPSLGAPLFTKPGFGASLAAIAPTATDSGIAAFQANDPATFEALDPIEQRYTVSGGAVKPQGTPATLFQLTTADTPVWMFTDPSDRLWLGVSTPTGSKFLVVARQ